MEFYAYRHKEHKDIWLRRNCNCGGSPDTRFYDMTRDPLDAIRSVNGHGDNFEYWFEYPSCGRRESVPTKVDVVLRKKFEFDGYSGTMEKKIVCTTADFEKVIFREVE